MSYSVYSNLKEDLKSPKPTILLDLGPWGLQNIWEDYDPREELKWLPPSKRSGDYVENTRRLALIYHYLLTKVIRERDLREYENFTYNWIESRKLGTYLKYMKHYALTGNLFGDAYLLKVSRRHVLGNTSLNRGPLLSPSLNFRNLCNLIYSSACNLIGPHVDEILFTSYLLEYVTGPVLFKDNPGSKIELIKAFHQFLCCHIRKRFAVVDPWNIEDWEFKS